MIRPANQKQFQLLAVCPVPDAVLAGTVRGLRKTVLSPIHLPATSVRRCEILSRIEGMERAPKSLGAARDRARP